MEFLKGYFRFISAGDMKFHGLCYVVVGLPLCSATVDLAVLDWARPDAVVGFGRVRRQAPENGAMWFVLWGGGPSAVQCHR